MSFTTVLLPHRIARIAISTGLVLLALGMLAQSTIAAEQGQLVKKSVVRFSKQSSNPTTSDSTQNAKQSDAQPTIIASDEKAKPQVAKVEAVKSRKDSRLRLVPKNRPMVALQKTPTSTDSSVRFSIQKPMAGTTAKASTVKIKKGTMVESNVPSSTPKLVQATVQRPALALQPVIAKARKNMNPPVGNQQVATDFTKVPPAAIQSQTAPKEPVHKQTIVKPKSKLVKTPIQKKTPVAIVQKYKQPQLRVPPPLRKTVAVVLPKAAPLQPSIAANPNIDMVVVSDTDIAVPQQSVSSKSSTKVRFLSDDAKPLVPLKPKTDWIVEAKRNAEPLQSASILVASLRKQDEEENTDIEADADDKSDAKQDEADVIALPSNPCCVPGIDNELASGVTLKNRSWLGISPVFSTEDKDYRERSMPTNIAASKFGSFDNASHIGNGCARYDIGTEVTWAAPSFYHRPLYFEQPMLERYGHFHHDWKWESVRSTAHFFSTTLILPYKIGAEPLCEHSYTLGRYRPGNCNPTCREFLPHSKRGFLFQGLATSGFVLLFP